LVVSVLGAIAGNLKMILYLSVKQMEKVNTEGYIPLNNSSGEELRFAVYRNVLAIFTQE
jgi:hypothetical protein